MQHSEKVIYFIDKLPSSYVGIDFAVFMFMVYGAKIKTLAVN